MEVFSSIKRQFRRMYYWYFKRKYVLNQIKVRKGACSFPECSGCCPGFCPWIRKDGSCKRLDNRPVWCELFPFDDEDKNDFAKKNCTLYFDPI